MGRNTKGYVAPLPSKRGKPRGSEHIHQRRRFWWEIACAKHGRIRAKYTLPSVLVLVKRKITSPRRHPQSCPYCVGGA